MQRLNLGLVFTRNTCIACLGALQFGIGTYSADEHRMAEREKVIVEMIRDSDYEFSNFIFNVQVCCAFSHRRAFNVFSDPSGSAHSTRKLVGR